MPFTVSELKQKTVAVLFGGLSAEREVSLRSGKAVSDALEARGFRVARIDVGREPDRQLREAKADVAFVTLHGRWGEDGCIQGLLEALFVPYTGSGVLASAMAMDKVVAKQVFAGRGIPVAEARTFETLAAFDAAGGLEALPFGLPCIVKPSREGSSVGVSLVKEASALRGALEEAAKHPGELLVERYVKGREIQVGVLGAEALGCIEVKPAGEFYDFASKYQSSQTRYLFPAPITAEEQALCEKTALSAHRALGCAGASRTDLILTPDGKVIVLEVNTLPGMTEKSLLPKIAAGRGWDFGELCERILLTAALHA